MTGFAPRRGGGAGGDPVVTARRLPTEAAFDTFFARVWSRLQGQAYVLTGSREQAQDLTQEALLRAWTHWDRIGSFDNPEAWTRRVLHNLCIASWRRSRIRARADGPSVDGAGAVGAPDTSPDDHVALAQALRRLPPAQARALLLHDGLGHTVAETATELGVPEGTVKSWLSRSRRIVAGRLDRSVTETCGGAAS